jgi:hypothetical protein
VGAWCQKAASQKDGIKMPKKKTLKSLAKEKKGVVKISKALKRTVAATMVKASMLGRIARHARLMLQIMFFMTLCANLVLR